MAEEEMRDSKVPAIHSEKELVDYIRNLLDQEHDYGTAVYAVSMAATAAFNYTAHILGITGFQASCADLDILRRTRLMENGFRILNYEDLLYPQYLNDEHFPGYEHLIKKNIDRLSKRAKELLDDSNEHVHPEVKKHWEYLAQQGE